VLGYAHILDLVFLILKSKTLDFVQANNQFKITFHVHFVKNLPLQVPFQERIMECNYRLYSVFLKLVYVDGFKKP
jgi:hypothetical protein